MSSETLAVLLMMWFCGSLCHSLGWFLAANKSLPHNRHPANKLKKTLKIKKANNLMADSKI